MDKYINYLLEDIETATEDSTAYLLNEFDDGEDYLPLEEEEALAPRKPLAQHIGVEPVWFPPAERLEESHIEMILDRLLDGLHAVNLAVNFPDGLPQREAYRVLISYLEQEVPVLKYNTWQIEFCDYESRGCPFGEQYCQCRMYERWLDRLQYEEEENEELEEEEELHLQYRLPGFLFDDWVDESRSSYASYEEDEEEDWDDEEGDDFYFPGLNDFRPDPDDDGRWN